MVVGCCGFVRVFFGVWVVDGRVCFWFSWWLVMFVVPFACLRFTLFSVLFVFACFGLFALFVVLCFALGVWLRCLVLAKFVSVWFYDVW